MPGPEPLSDERRRTLSDAVRRLVADAGPDAAPLVDPALALEVVVAVSDDLAAAIAARTAAGVDTVEQLVDALIDAVLEACAPWSEAIMLVGSTLERIQDFDEWSRLVGTWVGAVEHALAVARERGVVDRAVDPRLTALVLRDALQQTARSTLRFEFAEARAATKAFMCAALRPEAEKGTPTG